jgi:hypothetical protein
MPAAPPTLPTKLRRGPWSPLSSLRRKRGETAGMRRAVRRMPHPGTAWHPLGRDPPSGFLGILRAGQGIPWASGPRASQEARRVATNRPDGTGWHRPPPVRGALPHPLAGAGASEGQDRRGLPKEVGRHDEEGQDAQGEGHRGGHGGPAHPRLGMLDERVGLRPRPRARTGSARHARRSHGGARAGVQAGRSCQGGRLRPRSGHPHRGARPKRWCPTPRVRQGARWRSWQARSHGHAQDHGTGTCGVKGDPQGGEWGTP